MGGKDLPSYPEKSLPPIHLNHIARVCMQAQQSVYKGSVLKPSCKPTSLKRIIS